MITPPLLPPSAHTCDPIRTYHIYSMDHESPIKAWVRKHSPLKTRFATNKPLPPPPPPEESPTKQRNDVRHPPAAPIDTVTKGPSKFLSFLKKSTHPEHTQPVVPDEEVTPPRRKRGAFASLTSRDGLHRSPIRKSLRKQPSVDLNKLSQKVSTLEAQLREARQELDTVVGSVRQQDSGSTNSEKINKAVLAKQQSLTAGDRYDGLVESLLGQKSPSYKQHSLNSSTDLPRAYAEYLAVENALEAEEGRDSVASSPRHNKRKRPSAVPSLGASSPTNQSPESPPPQHLERPPTRRKSDHHKDLPPPPPSGFSAIHNTPPTTAPPPRLPRPSDVIRKQPHLPPPRADSLPRPQQPVERQPRKAPSFPSSAARQQATRTAPAPAGVLYSPLAEPEHDEYTSSGSSSPLTPPGMLQENMDPAASSSPFRESPTPAVPAAAAAAAVKMPPAQKQQQQPKSGTLTPLKRHVRAPAKLSTVDEEFEWNDEEIF